MGILPQPAEHAGVLTGGAGAAQAGMTAARAVETVASGGAGELSGRDQAGLQVCVAPQDIQGFGRRYNALSTIFTTGRTIGERDNRCADWRGRVRGRGTGIYRL